MGESLAIFEIYVMFSDHVTKDPTMTELNFS